MAKQEAKVSLVGLLASKKAEAEKVYQQNKGKEFNPGGFQEFPEGIKGGIAQLVAAKGGIYASGEDKGKPYAGFRVVAVHPLVHNDQRVRGIGHFKMFPLFEQPKRITKTFPNGKSWADNYAEFLNALRGFGVMDCRLDQIDGVLDLLTKRKPFIYFSTSGYTPEATTAKPNPSRIINVYFNGLVPQDKLPQAPSAAEGMTGPATEEVNDEPTPDEEESGSRTTNQSNFVEVEDLDDLGERGDKGEEAAYEKLKEIARAHGFSEKEIDDSADWTSLAAQVKSKIEGGTSSEEPPFEPQQEITPPKKGDVMKYVDPKKKKGSKPVDVEVTKVNVKKETVDLMGVADKKLVYTDIEWNDPALLPS